MSEPLDQAYAQAAAMRRAQPQLMETISLTFNQYHQPPVVDIRANIASTIAYINARYGLCSDCLGKLNRVL